MTAGRVLATTGCVVLLAAAGRMAAGAQAVPSPLTITLAGQSMLRSDLRATAPKAVPVIAGLLKGDVVFTNFEGAIALPGQSVSEGRGFLAPPEALDAFKALGFNLLSLSNNHAFDLQATGIRNTIAETNRRQIVHAGIGHTLAEAAAPAYLKTPKGTIALVSSASGLVAPGGMATASSPGVNELRIKAGDKDNTARDDLPGAGPNSPSPDDAERILNSIREARSKADVVIVYQHNHVFSNRSFATIFTYGLAERLAPNAWLKKWVHAEIDAGADIVVMHGAPLLHGVEFYRGKPIFYDLGNFIYNVPPTLTYIHEPINFQSAVAHLEYRGKTLRSIAVRPIVMNVLGQGQPDVQDPRATNQFLFTRGLPAPATGAEAGYILERLADYSRPLGTQIDIKGETAEIRIKK
ncbi:MAG TPA: CapA family protein [Vicinamibacterales bacterium]|jgi:poly-gamma-glutamate synthesis protein (capsule biosynthesis protein)|nr:CapA family protein [Vicinamibacterales bacterium]